MFRTKISLNKSDGAVVYMRDVYETTLSNCSEANCIDVGFGSDICGVGTYSPPSFRNPLSDITL